MRIHPFGPLMLGPDGIDAICMSTLHVCGSCQRPNAEKRCGACQCARYCSRECQAAAWKSGGHKSICVRLRMVLPPSWENSEDAALVEEEETAPEAALLAAQGFDLIHGKVGTLESAAFKTQEEMENLPDTPCDATKGHKLLLEAAKLGNKAAQYQTALNYLPDNNGREFEADARQALEWVKRAAKNGHAEAQMTYACQYWLNKKDGHPMDNVQAVIWLRRALAHGVSPTGGPDPSGTFLSRRSFDGGLMVVTRTARRVYLEHMEQEFRQGDDDDEDMLLARDRQAAMTLAADCGIVAALDFVLSKRERKLTGN